MKNIVRLVTNTSGDWTIAYLNGHKFYEGHCGTNMMFVELCHSLGIHMEREEVSDEKMERLCNEG